jgi:hypothetical protein
MTYELVQFGFFKGLLALHVKWSEEPLEQIQKQLKKWSSEPNKKFILVDARFAVLDPLEVLKATSLFRDIGYFVILWIGAEQNHALYKTVQSVEVWITPGEEWIELRPNALIIEPLPQYANSPGVFRVPEHLSDLPVFIAWTEPDVPAATIASIAEGLSVPCRIQKATSFLRVSLDAVT